LQHGLLAITTLIFSFTIIFSQDTLFISSSFGDFTDASSISSSRGEFIFVADAGTNKIYKYNKECKLLADYGGPGLGKYELNQPVSIDASNGLDVFIADYLNNRIVRLDYNLNFIYLFNFNLYNPLAESSKKIFNPISVALLSSDELFILCDAGNYNAVRMKEFNEIDIFFAQVSDKVINPIKIVRGNSLDLWILEKTSNELMNFNNLGIFVKRIKLPESLKPISLTYFDKTLLILFNTELYFYDLEKGKFDRSYFIPELTDLKDINVMDKETIFISGKRKVYKFNLTEQ